MNKTDLIAEFQKFFCNCQKLRKAHKTIVMSQLVKNHFHRAKSIFVGVSISYLQMELASHQTLPRIDFPSYVFAFVRAKSREIPLR